MNDWRWLPLTVCNLGLLALTAMVNDGLAPWNVCVFLAGLTMVWPALRLRTGGLLLCVLISGMAGDAMLPTPAGFLTTLYAVGAGSIVMARGRLGRTSRVLQVGLAMGLNFAYFAGFTIWAAMQTGPGASFWARAAVDLCFSQVILLPVGLWFFELQESALRFAGLPVAVEPSAWRP